MRFLVFLFIVMITPLILYYGGVFILACIISILKGNSDTAEKEAGQEFKEEMVLHDNVKQGNDAIKIIFKENNLVSKIKYKSFLFFKIPLFLICYGVLISLISSFNFDDLNDLFSLQGFISMAIILFIVYSALKNYNYFKVLRIRVQERGIEGENTHIILSSVTEKYKPSKLTGALKYKYEYTFIWEGHICSGINNDVNDHIIGKKLLDYLISKRGINIPAKKVNNTVFVDPNLLEEYLKKGKII